MRKSVLFLAAALAAVATQAVASDLATKAVPYTTATPSTISWNGAYVGINGGYGWSRGSQSIVGADPNGNFALANGIVPGAMDVSGKGALIGGTLGYNWQFGNIVTGAELDFDWANVQGSSVSQAVQGPASVTSSASTKLTWLSTARARLGYLVTPATLVYGTGGVALGHVSSQTSNVVAGAAPFNGVAALDASATKWGWTLGGGVEQQVFGNWSAKVEYAYTSLGSVGGTYGTTLGAGPGALPVHFTESQKVREQAIKVGLNYHF